MPSRMVIEKVYAVRVVLNMCEVQMRNIRNLYSLGFESQIFILDVFVNYKL